MGHVEDLEVFKNHLRAHGQRYTPERAVVLEAALDCKDHFSAETLAQEIRRTNRAVSLATVYRTLPVLVQCGFIQPTVKQGDIEYYERRLDEKHHHDHLLCIRCGKMIEFCSPVIEEAQEKIAATHGFRLTGHSLVLRGECKDCPPNS